MYELNSRILIVDDMNIMRKIVIKNLKLLGFSDFIEANDGVEGWEIVQAGSITVVISDWSMPNCTGIDFLKRVRGDSRFCDLPFVLLTAESAPEQVEAAVRCGVDSYMVKPVTLAILRKKLGEAFERSQTRSRPKAG